ncbi:hypothetical protein SLA2020_510640 [Shorea laevis]
MSYCCTGTSLRLTESFDELEEALLVSDFGPRIRFKIVESLREDIFSGKLKLGTEIKDALKKSVLDLLTKKGNKTEL